MWNVHALKACYQREKDLKAQWFLNGGLWTVAVVLVKETAKVPERAKWLAACTRVHSTPIFFSGKTTFFPNSVHKAGSQALSLQHINISRFKTMHLRYFGWTLPPVYFAWAVRFKYHALCSPLALFLETFLWRKLSNPHAKIIVLQT